MSTTPSSLRQRGFGLIGLLATGAVLGAVLVMGLRSVPAITEYLAVQRIVAVLAAEGDTGRSDADLRTSFDRRAPIDEVVSVSGADLQIRRDGGRTVVQVDYIRVVPMVHRLSLQIDFHASSARP